MNVRIQKSPIHGKGVFANEPIEKDHWQFIYGDLRVLVPGDPLEAHGVEWDDDQTFMPYAPWFYTNHSSEPNCEVTGDPDDHIVMVITALRDISQDEEILIDYGHDPSKD